MPWILGASGPRGQWRLGIGDPTPLGWFTVAAYLAAALACALVWKADRGAARQGQPASPRLWLVLTLLLLLLGINKQLDLQTLLGDLGRRLARAQGWYAQRRAFQAVFIAMVSTAGVIALGIVCWLGRGQWRRTVLAQIGTAFLYVFVLIRATSIHHVDAMLRWQWLGWTWNGLLELGGIAVVGLGALMALTSTPGGTSPTRDAPEMTAAANPDDSRGPRRYRVER